MNDNCINTIDKLISEGKIKKREEKKYKELCRLEEQNIKTRKVTQVSYTEILGGVLGGFVFVLALIFRDLITNSIMEILPDIESYYMDLILIVTFLTIVFILVFLRFRANQTNKRLSTVMDIKNISF